MPMDSVSPPLRTKQHSIIKIKSPKSDIKVHKLNYSDSTKITPELASKGNILNHLHNDDVEKLTQCWNNLKVRALSKAIVIAPDVGACTLGPKSPSTSHLDCAEPDDVDCDKPDLSQAITSTPVKCHAIKKNRIKTESFNLSQVKDSLCDSNSSDEESSRMDTLKIICQKKIEAYIDKCVQEKRELFLKSWKTHDRKMKEKCWALKTELDNERILRKEEQNNAVRKIIMATEANAQIKAQQQQQQKVDHDKRLAETGEKLRQIEQKRKEAEEKRKKTIEELKRCIEGIYNMQVTYNRKYGQICEMNKMCKDIRLLNEKVSGELPKLKAMNGLMFKLAEKSNEGKVVPQDLKTAEALVQQITVISEIFAKCVYEINKSLEEADVEKPKEIPSRDPRIEVSSRDPRIEVSSRDPRIKQEVAVHKEKPSIESVEKPKAIEKPEKLLTGVEDCISSECLKWYLELSNYLEEYEKKLEPLITSDSFKKFRFDCQKVVNVPVNAISPLDDLHLQDKLYKLTRILQGQAAPLGNSLFLVTGHPLGVSFCTNLLAKKFVKQGEHTVSSKPEAAFAIAAVIVALWADFPEFGRLLLAHFHRECPYLVPAFLPQLEGQSNESYYRMLGYQYSEDGKVEPQDKFLRRMSGVMRLYAAILVTPLRRSQVAEGKQQPHSMKEAWRWITAFLNLSPRPDISPTILLDFLEVAGGMMFRTYRAQFTKLLQFLWCDYYPMIEQVTPDGCGGPVTRLRSFLEKVLKECQVPPPPGLLPPNFW